MDNQKSIEARREARRRKILENATNRLEKLNGRNVDMIKENNEIKNDILQNPHQEIKLDSNIENLFYSKKILNHFLTK